MQERRVEGVLKQVPIYFASEALSGSKLLHSEMDKMAYVVVVAARKLWYYFQSYKFTVPTSYPLWDMFEKERPPGESESGQRNSQNTQSTSLLTVRSSPRFWQLS
jgi:hypothetical protein